MDAGEETSLVEVPQAVPSQEHCLSLGEVNLQSEGPQMNQEVATDDNAGSISGQIVDSRCKNDLDGPPASTKCLSVPPENDFGSPHTPRLLTIEHSSKGDCARERFSEPPCSEENSSDNSTQFGITPKQLLVNTRCTLREIHYKVLAHSTPSNLESVMLLLCVLIPIQQLVEGMSTPGMLEKPVAIALPRPVFELILKPYIAIRDSSLLLWCVLEICTLPLNCCVYFV